MADHSTWKRPFAAIYTGQAFSLVSSGAAQFALIWWITVRYGSGRALAMAGIFGLLPQVLLGPFVGVWVDRLRRKHVMIAADALVALAGAALAWAFFAGRASLPAVYAALFARALGSAFHMPALQATIPLLVPRDQITRAGGWGSMVLSGSSMLSPVLGAAWMAALPVGGILLADVAGAAIAIATVAPLRLPELDIDRPRRHVLGDLADGLRALWRNRPLVRATLPILLASLVYMPLGSLYPLMVFEAFGGTAWHNGLVEVLFAAGMMAASALIGAVGAGRRRFWAISAAIVAFGAATAAAGLLPAGGIWAFAALTFVMGATGAGFSVLYTTYIQETTPPENLGKVMALSMAMIGAAMPLGLLAAGPLADAIGTSRYFLYSGALMALTGLLCRAATARFDGTKGRNDA
ncbi:MAG: MFS transporter [Clostridiales bacterium]|nr:MFS transporter [Clostridiales bacterium]